jgi:hypothetical protein
MVSTRHRSSLQTLNELVFRIIHYPKYCILPNWEYLHHRKVYDMQHLMVRVVSPSFDGWLEAFNYANTDMANFGITGWRVYRENDDSNAVMVHFMVDDIGKAMEFFRSAKFQEANKMAGVTDREFYIAEKK